MSDYPDWQNPVAVADQLALLNLAKDTTVSGLKGIYTDIPTGVSLLGVPLKTQYTAVFNRTSTLAAGANFTSGNFPIEQLSYEAHISLVQHVAGSALPTVQMDLIWTDSVSGLTTTVERHVFLIGSPGNPHIIKGFGPSRGDQLNVSLTNNDSVQLDYVVLITSNSRIVSYPDLRTDTITAVNGLSLPNSDLQALQLASGGPSVGAGATVERILPYYSRRAFLRAFCNNAFNVDISSFDPNTPGTPAVASLFANPGTRQQAEILFPRSQCKIGLTNNGAGAASINFNIVAEAL